jgi:hypothetical protein
MEATRRVRSPHPIWWLDCVEQDFKTLKIESWKKKALERDQRRVIVEATVKACNRLQNHWPDNILHSSSIRDN